MVRAGLAILRGVLQARAAFNATSTPTWWWASAAIRRRRPWSRRSCRRPPDRDPRAERGPGPHQPDAGRRTSTTVACAFPTLQKAPGRGGRARQSWSAIRSARRSAPCPTVAYVPPDADGPIHLLVTGGSQGARLLSELVPEAMAALPEDLRKRLKVQQQTRAEIAWRARASVYRDAVVEAEVAPFFRDMAEPSARRRTW